MKILKELRLQNKKTQQQVASLLNVTQQTYGRYELDQIEPPHEILLKLAEYYNVSLDYLFGRSGGSAPPITDPNIKIIARSAKNLTSENTEALLRYAKFMFPEAFEDDK